jgi:hypothetical protein
MAGKGKPWKDEPFAPAKGVELRQATEASALASASGARPGAGTSGQGERPSATDRETPARAPVGGGANRDIPPEVKWLADVLGLDPHFVMRNPTSYMRRTGGPAPLDGDLDPDRFD